MHRQAKREALNYALSFGIASATGPVRIPGSAELGILPRLCAPIRCQGLLLGYLFLIDADESLTDADLVKVTAAGDAAGAVLYQEQLLGELERSRERELLRDLLSDDAALAGAAARELVETDIVTSAGDVVALTVRIAGTDAPVDAVRLALGGALDEVRRTLSPRHVLALSRTDHGVLVAFANDPALRPHGLAGLGEALRAATAKAAGALGVGRAIVGIGDEQPELATIARSYRRAQTATDVASIVPSFGDVVAWRELGVYRTLAQVPRDELESEAIHPGLRRLLEGDGNEQLVDTLESFLDRAGDVKGTAAALCIHRTSLYYRLSRVEQLTGCDLGNGNDRLALHLGLKVARLSGIRR